MKKIVYLDSYTLNPGDLEWEALEKLGEFIHYPRSPEATVTERCRDAQIIITNKVVLDEHLIKQLPALECICVSATGYNNVDITAAKKRGIPVYNVIGYSTPGVAQHVFALLLELCNRVGWHEESVKRGEWANALDWCYWKNPIVELAGLTMGIIGYGKIGRQVGQIASAFGMKVIVKRRGEKKKEASLDWVDTESLFSQSDVISLHIPLTTETEGLVNKETLALMKPSAFLINTARGGLIVEKELRSALLNHQIAGAALDVLSVEPPAEDHPLIGLPNCIITPHQAWAARASRQRLLQGVIKNVQSFLEGDQSCRVNQ